MASKQERRIKAVGVIKCLPCQANEHANCSNISARYVRICDCKDGAHS